MVRLIIEGWLLGLSTGPYCLGACMPFMVPYLFADGQATWGGNARVIGEFLLGRFLAYLLFGMAVGWIGERLPRSLAPLLTSVALGLSAALMLVYAFVHTAPSWNICGRLAGCFRKVRVPLLLGLLIGINVCPPFLVAVARLLQTGEVAGGAVFFAAFFAGTTLYTLPLLGLSPLTRRARWQRIGRLCALLIGSWYLVAALGHMR